ncbi:histone deacetylase family protein, partial [Marinomonas arenicola]
GRKLRTAYITLHHCDKHDMGEAHPECPVRLGAIRDRLIAGLLLDYLRCVEALPATRAQVKAVHDSAYVDSIFAKA